MIISKKVEKKLPVSDFENVYVIADFDRTLTNEGSKTSWSILPESELVPLEYKEERIVLYEKYRPIELDEKMNFTKRNRLVKEWYTKNIELFVKYKITKEIVEITASNPEIMEFRNGAKDFIKFLHDNNIPLIIISAGIGNFIECFLEHNDCYYEDVYASTNKIVFEDNVAIGIGSDVIHSFNKNEVSLPDNIKERVGKRNKVILLGDQISDLNMVDRDKHKDLITVGFFTKDNNDLESFKNAFDIVCENNDDYNDLLKIIFLDKK